MSIYKNYAKYYDLLYNDKDYKKEANYVNSLISKYSKGSKNILELGCGTGIHAIELAKKGYQIDGVDLSKRMVDIAKKRLDHLPGDISSAVSFKQGDNRKYRNQKKYSVVISLFHVIGYMNSNDDVEAMLKTVSLHLKKGGLFIFDCWYGPAVLTHFPEKRVKVFEDEEMKIIRKATPQVFPNKNLVDVNYEIVTTDRKTKKTEKNYETHTVRYLFKPEIEMFMNGNGFKLLNAEQWLTGENPGFDTWGVCFIAEKI